MELKVSGSWFLHRDAAVELFKSLFLSLHQRSSIWFLYIEPFFVNIANISCHFRRLAGNDLSVIPRGAFSGLYNLKVL